MRLIRLNMDHRVVGSGSRFYLDLTRPGHKTALLLYIPRLRAIRVPLEVFKTSEEFPLDKGFALSQIRLLKLQYDNNNWRYSGSVVDDAISQLTEEE